MVGIGRGSLAVDEPILKDIGAFGRSSGAGTVSAVGALFLASRYAAQPVSGVVAAAFAKGADTDTLAAMTGAILGAIHGSDWLAPASRRLQDAEYMRALARSTIAGLPEDGGGEEDVAPMTTRSFWNRFGEPEAGESVELPGGHAGTVKTIAKHDTKRDDLRPLTWVVSTDDGQTLYFKRVKKLPGHPQASPTPAPREQTAPDEVDRRPRIAVVLHVTDIAQARSFYRDVIGLEITTARSERTVFAGLLALEPITDSHESNGNQQLALERADTPGSFVTSCAVTFYVHKFDFDDIRARIAHADRPLGEVVTQEGRPTFRCLDPDGNVIEFRTRNGA
jgi:catechol 2,3-dioxygenase-like lactoylglutathione lyase family enzyme